ncbi:hypothetical protein BDV27DRAFT_154932 [Aspergillus caelatus]|uniref:Uncharacterized protein n=1 Tax=Aspergillus caelatus TaxID=61420 RepID=A0A5N7AEJ9_9EURO|nr:uncharacterized protein BDV27DRAFT_154932 [Aspergillus caelatus]KAE8367499.1 hypothetical protein BDV27DRAFT_154932 [Aspergillus caelatus]
MVELTVGYVSGIIAAGVFVARYLFPTLSALILVSFLQEKNTAITWSVLARTLQSSLWPTILRSDSDCSTEVDRAVSIESWIRLVVAVIISTAGIVTPLGLYDAVLPAPDTTPKTFRYIPDQSPMGAATPPRHSLGFNRRCGLYICPGSNSNITVVSNLVRDAEWNITIPWDLTYAFASGLPELSPTVSSIWDIEWRNYELTQRKDYNKGSLYAVGSYRQAENRILSDRIEVAEGIIMDTKNGGIGFRNHTLPPRSKYGSTWTEDLLFVVPQTSCVNLNLTLDFKWQSGPVNVTVTDRGGFVNLHHQQPEHSIVQTQDNFDLHNKAYTAAWLTNAMGMVYFNVTNPSSHGYAQSFEYVDSAVGKSFPILNEGSGQSWGTDGILTSTMWGDFFNIPDADYNASGMASDIFRVRYPNPFNITRNNFTNIGPLCQGVSRLDYANMTNVGVVCGAVYGAARRTDGGNSLIREPASPWQIPIYSCASAAKALIKTVRFRYDGSGGLGGLSVVDMTEKTYQTEDENPLWGVENTSLPIDVAQPLWGIVSKEYQNRNDISVIRKGSLWLPGFGSTSLGSPVDGLLNLPGASFHLTSFAHLYSLSSTITDGVGDYTGQTSSAVYSKWREYSTQADTTSTIINLIWTDIVANAVVGTRGWLSPSSIPVGSANDSAQVEVPVTEYRNTIQYRVPFGIPAFVALFGLLLSMVTVFILLFCGKARPYLVRRYLNYTSVGRTMTLLLYPGSTEPQTSTTIWASSVGNKIIDAGELAPSAADPVEIETSPVIKGRRTL